MNNKVLYLSAMLAFLPLGSKAQKPVICLLGATKSSLQQIPIPDSSCMRDTIDIYFPVDSIPVLEPLKPAMEEIFPEAIKKEKL